MKATGIVRRIDDLGRVVIPKEMRRTLRIKEGDPLEIFVSEDGGVILHKYSAMTDLTEIANQFTESLSKASGHPALICDRDTVVSVHGAPKKEYLNRRVPAAMLQNMEERATIIITDKRDIQTSFFEGISAESISAMMITPVIAHGDVMGGVIIFATDNKTTLGDTEKKLSQAAATVLGKQLEH